LFFASSGYVYLEENFGFLYHIFMPTLHWLTREQDLKAASNAEYRLLVEEEKYSYGGSDTGNIIVQGDNLEALKALLPFYAGQVKCIYIDPPYNTGSAFDHYDDNMEHTIWLSIMYPRLKLLKQFLRKDGSIWISIDDRECHYLKLICDEIFDRNNFIATIIWRKNYAPKSSARHFSEDHDYILVYTRNPDIWLPNLMPRTQKQNKVYKNPDNDPRGLWRPNNLAARNFYSKGTYSITCPSGRVIEGPPAGSYWRVSTETFWELDKDGRIWWGKDGNNVPAPKIYLSEVKDGIVPQTLWSYEDVGHTQEAKKEIIALFENDVFGTPKPERLIHRIIHISTNPGDYVLDSFLGSGTTAAVAHKMDRKYIGVEIGEQAKTHCAARLRKVIDGEQGGISEAVGWKGGGGFRFFTLGDTVFDNERRIKPDISFENLAAHIYFTETKTPMKKHKKNSAFLGIHEGTAYALLYNGILGDKRVSGGNILTHTTLNHIRHDIEVIEKKMGAEIEYNQIVIYGEATRLTHVGLEFNNIIFKQTPYDIKVW
jgi:adenine-specific DNA-methyltransferase